MLRTVPKLNRITLRQAVMMPLCLSTTILSYIFITLIALFLPGISPVEYATGVPPASPFGHPGFEARARFIFSFATHTYGAQGRARTDTPKQLILNQPSLPIPSLGQITHLGLATPTQHHVFCIFLPLQILIIRVPFPCSNGNEVALVRFAHKLCALRPGPTTLFFS